MEKFLNFTGDSDKENKYRLSIPPLTIVLVLAAFLVIITRRAWLNDDAYITFRTVDNFVNGYRLTWNTTERVQAFTHPLWMFLVSIFYAITGEIYFTSLILSLALSFITVVVYAYQVAHSRTAALFGIIALGLSNAFVDYSTSGLENPLTHCILIVFFAIFFSGRFSIRNIFFLSLLASLAAVNRLDTLLIYIPPLLYLLWRARRSSAFLAVALGQIPLILWEIFSVIYYGFPFPNTAYAKLNVSISQSELWQQGFYYLQDSLLRDPLTLLLIVSSFVLVLLSRNIKRIAVVTGVFLYLVYVTRIGGDFMSGRFFAAPYLCSVVLITRFDFERFRPRTILVLIAGLALVGFSSQTPTFQMEDPGRVSQDYEHGVANERLYYFSQMGLLEIKFKNGEPLLPGSEDGLRAKSASEIDFYILTKGNVGVYGYYAGPQVFIIDYFALTDPLLSRLPPVRNLDWRIGHFHRIVPDGYVESVYNEESLLVDKDLAQYYEKLRLITHAELLDPQRWAAIWKMNTGQYDYLIDHDKYYLPEAVSLTLQESETMGKEVIFEDDGVLVDLGQISHAEKIEAGLGTRDRFRLSLRLKGEEVAVIEVPQLASPERSATILLDVPKEAVSSGYDSVRVLPTAGDHPYVMAGLKLVEQGGQP